MKSAIVVAVLALTAVPSYAQQVIAKDSAGLVVEVKEKYGGRITDTCTVVMLHQNQFVLVKRDGNSAWFPSSFHSVRVLGSLAGMQVALNQMTTGQGATAGTTEDEEE